MDRKEHEDYGRRSCSFSDPTRNKTARRLPTTPTHRQNITPIPRGRSRSLPVPPENNFERNCSLILNQCPHLRRLLCELDHIPKYIVDQMMSGQTTETQLNIIIKTLNGISQDVKQINIRTGTNDYRSTNNSHVQYGNRTGIRTGFNHPSQSGTSWIPQPSTSSGYDYDTTYNMNLQESGNIRTGISTSDGHVQHGNRTGMRTGFNQPSQSGTSWMPQPSTSSGYDYDTTYNMNLQESGYIRTGISTSDGHVQHGNRTGMRTGFYQPSQSGTSWMPQPSTSSVYDYDNTYNTNLQESGNIRTGITRQEAYDESTDTSDQVRYAVASRFARRLELLKKRNK